MSAINVTVDTPPPVERTVTITMPENVAAKLDTLLYGAVEGDTSPTYFGDTRTGAAALIGDIRAALVNAGVRVYGDSRPDTYRRETA